MMILTCMVFEPEVISTSSNSDSTIYSIFLN